MAVMTPTNRPIPRNIAAAGPTGSFRPIDAGSPEPSALPLDPGPSPVPLSPPPGVPSEAAPEGRGSTSGVPAPAVGRSGSGMVGVPDGAVGADRGEGAVEVLRGRRGRGGPLEG